MITSQDIRWWKKQAYDRALKLVYMDRLELPSDIAPRYAGFRRVREMIPMRDGVRLATDVYLPIDPVDGSPTPVTTGVPALVVRQPYGNREAFCFFPLQGRYWARRGYAFILQDIRGRWDSEGEYDPFVHEIDDGYDTLDWVSRQRWCNGTAGALGESYYGYTTWAMAVGGHPVLRAAAPGDTTVDMYASAFRNGAFCMNPFGIWALWINHKRFCNYYRVDPYKVPLETLDEQCGLSSRQWKMLISHFPKEEYWDRLDLTDRLSDVDIPLLHWSGWYDQFLGQTIAHWQTMRARRDDQFLVIGATDHMLSPERTGRIGRTKVAGIGKAHDRVCRFFDRYLTGADTEFPAAPVSYFTLGRDEWRTAPDWPPPDSRTLELFLGTGGETAATAAGAAAAGALLPAPPAAPAEVAYSYDPDDPVAPWVGTDGWSAAMELSDRAPLALRPDVLVFDSPPLAEGFELSGPLRVTLFAATSAEDTDFVATLDDVYPDGYAHLVQQGIVRARYHTPGRDEPVVPGAVVEYEIDLWAAGYVVAAGHRLRLEISSSEFDRYDRNLNVYETWGTATRPVIARQTIHLGGERPSRLTVMAPHEARFREGVQ